MRKSVLFLSLVLSMLVFAELASAKLPAPTLEEAKAKQAAAANKVKSDENAKQALARAQDRAVARYKARKR